MSFIGGYQSDLNLNTLSFVGNFPIEHSLGGFGIANGLNNYILTLSPPITEYRLGMPLAVKFQNNNTGVATINVDGEGVVSIKKIVAGNLVDIAANDLDSDKIYFLIYDGTYFQIVNLSESGGGSTEKISNLNRYMPSLQVVNDGDLACATGILETPVLGSGIIVTVNGVEAVVRKPTDTGKTFNTAGGVVSGANIINNTCRMMFLDETNHLMYVGANGGFWIYNMDTGAGVSVPLGSGAVSGAQLPNTAQAIYKDLTHNMLWVGTFNGLWQLNLTTNFGKLYTIAGGAANGQQLPGNDIQSVFIDEANNILYAGTAAGGMWRYNIATDTGKVFSPAGGAANGEQIPAFFITSFAKDLPANILYAGTLGGIWRYDENTSTGKVFSTVSGAGSGQQLNNANVRQVFLSENFLHAATDGGIWEYNINTDFGKRYTTGVGAVTGQQLPANDVRSVYRDIPSNTLYASTNSNGAWEISLETFHGKRYSLTAGATNGTQLPNNIGRTIIKIPWDDLFWVATFGGGVWEYRYKVGLKVNGFFSPDGIIKRDLGTEQVGDKLYWIPRNSGPLNANTTISFIYLK